MWWKVCPFLVISVFGLNSGWAQQDPGLPPATGLQGPIFPQKNLWWVKDFGIREFEWGTDYNLEKNSFTIGHLEITAKDSRFHRLKEGQCRRLTRPQSEIRGDRSTARFCLQGKGNGKPQVLIRDQEVDSRGAVSFTPGTPLPLTLVFGDGKRVELFFDLPAWTLWEASRDQARNEVILKLQVSDEMRRGSGFWDASSPAQWDIEEVRIPGYDTAVEKKGILGIRITKVFEGFEKLPTEDRRRQVTRGFSGYGDQVSGLYMDREGDEAEWTTPPLSRENRQWIPFQEKSRLQVVRAPNMDLGLSLSALMGPENETLLSGEASFQMFHEHLWQKGAGSFDRQRFSWKAKAYRTLQSPKKSDAQGVNLYSVDLRMAYQPGVWNLEETWGGLLSTTSLDQGPVSQPSLGFGVFWARSLPEGLDYWWRKIPGFDFPKYVEAEVSYSPLSLSSRPMAAPLIQINARGKMWVGANWYLGAGISYLSYQIQDAQLRQGFSTLSGQFGLGKAF